jgi:hypothetical protein
MVQTPNSNPQPESLPLNPILLADAWRIYNLYDKSAVNVQKGFIFLRLLILRLSILVTFLAIVNSQIQTNPKTNTIPNPEFKLQITSFLTKLHLIGLFHFFHAKNLLDISVIIAPITVSILLAEAVKFGRGVNWILLRGSAETLKQEIYRYRTQIKDYRDPKTRDTNFAQEIQTISERLMKTQVNQAGLRWDEVQPYKSPSLLRVVLSRIDEIFNKLRKKLSYQFSRLVKWVLRISESSENSDKSPTETDLFSVLKAEDYINFRLINQLGWYRRKTLDLDKKWQWWQWWIYIIGGIGTYLAAIKWDVWIAVTNSIAAAVLSFLEFRRFDSTLVGYNQTATNLENILCWWHALTPEAKDNPINVEKLVESSEKVIRAETTGWVQEMRDALATLYEEKEPPKKDEDPIESKKELPKENEDPSKDENRPSAEENELLGNANNEASSS